jgi:hypothetical protein
MRKLLIVGLFVSIASAAFAQGNQGDAPLGDQSQPNTPPAANTAPATTPLAPPAAIPPSAPPPAASAPASGGNLQTVEAPVSPDCKLVKVSRPDVDSSKPNIVVRFKDFGKANIASLIGNCDQKASGSTFISITPWRTVGFQVKFATKDGAGMVSLPIALTDGKASQTVCKIDWATKTILTAKYAVQWSGGLQDEIKLQKLDSYDQAEAVALCRSVTPDDVLAKLGQ